MNVAAHAGEMRVNIGGEPGRDDYGLPPADVEIPDDARELDRDVQAYHRELRALRWRRRTRRLAGPLIRDGIVLPLLAGCLALTLLAGTLLTVFSGAQLTARSPVRPSRQLPDATVLVDGRSASSSSLHGSVLALVSRGCTCTHLRQLARQAAKATVKIYVVGGPGAQVMALIKRMGLRWAHAVEDTEQSLTRAYRQGSLTAVLVNDDGSIARVQADSRKGFQLASVMLTLRPHPGGTGAATVAAGPAGG